MQKKITIRNKGNNNQWQSELNFQTIIETECNQCSEEKMIFLASRNITTNGEEKFYCYNCATDTINKLQDPLFEFIDVEQPKEVILADLIGRLNVLKQNLNINTETSNNVKENTKGNNTTNTNTSKPQNTSTNTTQTPINDPQITKPKTEPQQKVATPTKTAENPRKETAEAEKGKERTTKETRESEQESKSRIEENKTEDFILEQVRNQKTCANPNCRKLITANNYQIADGCLSCKPDDRQEAIKRSAREANKYYQRYMEEHKKSNCSFCDSVINEGNERVELYNEEGIPYWKCQVCSEQKREPKPQPPLNDFSPVKEKPQSTITNNEKGDSSWCGGSLCRARITTDNPPVEVINPQHQILKRCYKCVYITKKEKNLPVDSNDLVKPWKDEEVSEKETKEAVENVEVDDIQKEINRLMELKRKKELQSKQGQVEKKLSEANNNIFECGTWQDLFTKERLPHLSGRVRLFYLDPPYGIAYKGFEYEKLTNGGNWVVNGVDFSFIPRAAEFLTQDGMMIMWNTLKNCLDLKEYIQKHKKKWKATVLYWVKPVFTTFGLNPIKNHLVIEGIICITVGGKTLTNDWYHGTIFSHPSKRSMDWIKKYLFSSDFKVFDENSANEEFQSARRIYSHNPETGNPYAHWTRETESGRKEAMTGIAWKPLTLYSELTNLYIKSTRPLNADDYIVDLFSGASSGSSYITSRLYNTKYWASEYDQETHKYLVEYLIPFMDKFLKADKTFVDVFEKVKDSCMCISYEPIGDKRKRANREKDLETRINELQEINKRLLTEQQKLIRSSAEDIKRRSFEQATLKGIVNSATNTFEILKKQLEKMEVLNNNSTEKKV